MNPQAPVTAAKATEETFRGFPREIRDLVYAALVDHDTAFILPHLFDLAPGDASNKIGITSADLALKLVSKQFRSEYLEILIKRTLDLQVGGICAYVVNFNFDTLTGSFLNKLTSIAYSEPEPDLLIDVYFCFSKSFREHLIDLNTQETSFGRWLEYRDQGHRDGKHVPMEYAMGNIELQNPDPICYFVDLYLSFLYANRVSAELDQVVKVVREHFENNVSYEEVTSVES